MKIPLYKPYISQREIKAVVNVLKSGKLSKGQEVEYFEREFADYVGKKYAVAVNSGTSGLHLLVRALNWQKGDEIITTPFSFIASSNALLFEDVTPVFVDIDPKTLNIDANQIEAKITPRTKGLLLVHIFGLPVDYQKIKRLGKKYKLPIIEDACEALARPSHKFRVNDLGVATVYGLYENKQITSGGEGGMIVTDSKIIAQKCRSMRDQGRSFLKNWKDNVVLGFNFRMTEMQAAFGRQQLKVINKILAQREKIAEKYSALFAGIDGIITPHQLTKNQRSWFAYFIILKDKATRDQVCRDLSSRGIASSTNYFPPIYTFPMYAAVNPNCPAADDISDRILTLPLFYGMTNAEIKLVINTIINSLKK